jgi:hypothetical protein
VKIERLTKVVHVIHYWDFILKSLSSISDKVREDVDEVVLQKTLIGLVADNEHAWLGIAFDQLEPIAFGVVQECTPEFDPNRCFVVRWFYHMPSRFDATVALMEEFERWAREQKIQRYAVTTRRSNGTAIRCFQSARYGFGKAFLTFEKEL